MRALKHGCLVSDMMQALKQASAHDYNTSVREGGYGSVDMMLVFIIID